MLNYEEYKTDGKVYVEGENHLFEIVDEIPKNYLVWNVGDIIPGYIPLCEMSSNDSGPYSIDPDTLKCIRCDLSNYVMSGIHYARNEKDIKYQIKTLYTYFKKYSKSKNAYTRLRADRTKYAADILNGLNFERDGE